MKATFLLLLSAGLLLITRTVPAQWPPPKAPAIPEADGYVEIPNAAVAPDRLHTYQAIFDATRIADMLC